MTTIYLLRRIGNDGVTNETLLFTDRALALRVAEDYAERTRNGTMDEDQILVDEYTGEGEMDEGDGLFDSFSRERVISAAMANFDAKHGTSE